MEPRTDAKCADMIASRIDGITTRFRFRSVAHDHQPTILAMKNSRHSTNSLAPHSSRAYSQLANMANLAGTELSDFCLCDLDPSMELRLMSNGTK